MKLKSKSIQVSCDGGAATGKSTGARMVARFAASKHNLDPTLAPYEIEGHNTIGPYSHIGKFIPDTPEHKQKTIAARRDLAGQKFLKEYLHQQYDLAGILM